MDKNNGNPDLVCEKILCSLLLSPCLCAHACACVHLYFFVCVCVYLPLVAIGLSVIREVACSGHILFFIVSISRAPKYTPL